MSPETFDAVARRFQILSEPLRLKLLQLLRDGEMNVGELVQLTGTSQPNVSKHLGILHSEGIVERRQKGTAAFYTIRDESIFNLCEMVCDGIERELDRRKAALA